MSHLTRVISGLLAALAVTGCASKQHAMETNKTNLIEFLAFDGCPNTPAMRESLTAAIEETGGSFSEIDLATLDDNDLRRGYGSPTILVDGHDLFKLPKPNSPTMSCRIYPGGLPDTDTLIAKLSEMKP
ncbi:MAG: hypothetical protein NXI07_10705 [bacterium]|nr:hypothetical protein [bacterium]